MEWPEKGLLEILGGICPQVVEAIKTGIKEGGGGGKIKKWELKMIGWNSLLYMRNIIRLYNQFQQSADELLIYPSRQ